MATLRPFNGRVIFDHLPKTAGQAVNAWLTDTLGARCVTTNLIGEHRTLIRRYGGEYPVISAHLDFHGGGLDPRYQYVTCLREPVDRAISRLFFIIENHEESQLGVQWRQAKRFVVTEGEELDQDQVRIHNPYVNHFASILSSDSPKSDADKLSAAMSAIEQYDVWGLFEDFPAFLADVAALIGVPAPGQIAPVNVTRARPTVETISPRLRMRLEELNALDIELYRMLRERWQTEHNRQPMVTLPDTSPWLPYNNVSDDRMHSVPEFTLLSTVLEGKDAFFRRDSIIFTLEFSLPMVVEDLVIGIHIFDEDGRWAFGTNTTLLKHPLLQIKPGTHRVQYCLIADLPEGKYTAGFAFVERHAEGERELAWYDKLVAFSVTVPRPQASVGYSSLPVAVNYRQTSDAVISLIEDARGSLRVDAALDGVAAGETFTLPVRMENASTQSWVSTLSNPLMLSYHWLDEAGNTVIFEGERTPLPVVELAPTQTIAAQLRVVAPTVPGSYRLVIVPVQERHCWLDERGFTPGVLDPVSVGQIERRAPEKRATGR